MERQGCKMGQANPDVCQLPLQGLQVPGWGWGYPGLHGPGQLCHTPAVWPWAGDSPCIVQEGGVGGREAAIQAALLSCPLRGREAFSEGHQAAVYSCSSLGHPCTEPHCPHLEMGRILVCVPGMLGDWSEAVKTLQVVWQPTVSTA